MGYENIKEHGFEHKTAEERHELAVKAGIKSGEVRRRKRNMREAAKTLLAMKVQGDSNRKNLKAFGIEEDDQDYQTAIVVRLLQKALMDGDTSAIRLLSELSGDFDQLTDELIGLENIVDAEYPIINLPDNGRDAVRKYQLAPQAGPQTMFMASSADIVIYGGAAGGGKTHALLLEGLRHCDVSGFGAVIFRKNYTQITAEGGLWDASDRIYSKIPGAISRKTPKFHWSFPGGGKIHFAHIGCEDDLKSWQGTELCLIGFDELTHFSRHQFLYMLSRNRSTCGVKPYVRATCNPDADSWVAEFISWWIDQDTGYPIPERSGMVRYMCTLNDTIYMADTKQELVDEHNIEETQCKTVTFISSKLENNKILMEKDPGYIANLKALPQVEMERLLNGNWKIKPAAGLYFRREHLGEILQGLPNDEIQWVRCWHLAATDKDENGDAAYTAGVLMGKRKNGRYIVVDVINKQLKASDVRATVKHTAQSDRAAYKRVRIRLPKDPGQAGKEQAQSYIKFLSGFDVTTVAETGSKVSRAEPMAAQWQAGNFDIMYGEWKESFLSQLENFPDGKFKDMVDAAANGFAEIEIRTAFNVNNLL